MIPLLFADVHSSEDTPVVLAKDILGHSVVESTCLAIA